MGKKSREKNQKNNRRKKSIKPDDYFRLGPLEMARFGKIIVTRNTMSDEQFKAMQERLAEQFPVICQEIDEIIAKIADLVKMLPPDRLLHRAAWENARHHLNIKSEIEIDHEAAMSLRMIDYVQSIIASVLPTSPQEEDVSEERWQKLKGLVTELFKALNSQFMISQTAANRKTVAYNEDLEEFYFKAQMFWCNIRGKRYLFHDIPFYRDVLSPHDGILKELYSIRIDDLLEGLQKIQDALTRGIIQACEDLREFQKLTSPKILEKLEGLKSTGSIDPPELMELVIKENGWEALRDDVLGRFFGLDIFDLEKITKLPKSLLDDLSLEPGQDTSFFADGEYKGWPLRIWPVFRYPFIRIGGRYFCFDIYSLFDNLYRVIQRIIIGKRPDYAQTWNNKQQNLSEQLPHDLFLKLLPGAQMYHPVYYRWKKSKDGAEEWCEADALVSYEDHLFIIEVKAGAFTYTPPTTDFPAYVDSLKNLIHKPAEQGKRFLEYLRSDDEVLLYDKGHKEIGKLSSKGFEHTTICAVTLDPFTEIAAQVQHLKKLGIDVGTDPVWSISIDDLRVYTEVFDNPLTFLHFVEQRMRAFCSELIRTDDELDHLGLYIKHNVYTEYAKDHKKKDLLIWHGYRSEIDAFFADKLIDSTTKCLIKQKMPYRLEEIVNLLKESRKPGRRKITSTILDTSGEWRTSIAAKIDETLSQQSKLHIAKPLSAHGGQNITLFCWQQGILERDEKLALEHTYTAMLAAREGERILLELIYDSAGNLTDEFFAFLRADTIPVDELEALKMKADKLRIRRINAAKETRGKIGQNDQCPCGSGKKYKKCCISLMV
jgi:hypothetical protein